MKRSMISSQPRSASLPATTPAKTFSIPQGRASLLHILEILFHAAPAT